MQTLKLFLNKAATFLKTRGLGFWLLAAASLIALVMPFIYLAGFKATYFSAVVMTLSFLAVSGLAAALFTPTARYAPLITFAFWLAAFLTFIKTSYMYLTSAFFGGISGNILVQAGFHYSFCVIAFITGMGLSIASAFLRQSRKSVRSIEPAGKEGGEQPAEQKEADL